MNAVPPDHIVWNWESQVFRVGTDRLGVGPTVLLLPALSSISTRREMRLLQERLAPSFATVAIDWPGFGEEPRPESNGDLMPMSPFFGTSSPRWYLDHSQHWRLDTRPAMPSPWVPQARIPPGRYA